MDNTMLQESTSWNYASVKETDKSWTVATPQCHAHDLQNKLAHKFCSLLRITFSPKEARWRQLSRSRSTRPSNGQHDEPLSNLYPFRLGRIGKSDRSTYWTNWHSSLGAEVLQLLQNTHHLQWIRKTSRTRREWIALRRIPSRTTPLVWILPHNESSQSSVSGVTSISSTNLSHLVPMNPVRLRVVPSISSAHHTHLVTIRRSMCCICKPSFSLRFSNRQNSPKLTPDGRSGWLRCD